MQWIQQEKNGVFIDKFKIKYEYPAEYIHSYEYHFGQQLMFYEWIHGNNMETMENMDNTYENTIEIKNILFTKKSNIKSICINDNISFVCKTYMSTTSNIYNEYTVGIILNKLKKIIPQFSYIYAIQENTIWMEYCKGIPFFKWIQSKPNIYDIMEVLIQIACAIQVAFEHTYFIHGDLSPWNILIHINEYPIEYTFPLYNQNKLIKITSIYSISIVDFEKGSILYKDIYINYHNHISYNGSFDMIMILIYVIDICSTIYKEDIDILIYMCSWLPLNERITDISQLKNTLYTYKSYSNIYHHFKEKYMTVLPYSWIEHIANRYVFNNIHISNLNIYLFYMNTNQRGLSVSYYLQNNINEEWFIQYYTRAIHKLNNLSIFIDMNIYDVFVKFPNMINQIYKMYDKYKYLKYSVKKIDKYMDRWVHIHEYITSIQNIHISYPLPLNYNEMYKNFLLISNKYLSHNIISFNEYKLIYILIFMNSEWQSYHICIFKKLIQYTSYQLYLNNMLYK